MRIWEVTLINDAPAVIAEMGTAQGWCLTSKIEDRMWWQLLWVQLGRLIAGTGRSL
jgi:hypothetical protein